MLLVRQLPQIASPVQQITIYTINLVWQSVQMDITEELEISVIFVTQIAYLVQHPLMLNVQLVIVVSSLTGQYVTTVALLGSGRTQSIIYVWLAMLIAKNALQLE